MREGIESFAIKSNENGENAKLIESLKKSALEYRTNALQKMPAEWIE